MSPFSRQLRVVHDQPAGEQADSPTLRIAFATSDKQRVDEHFGSCTCLQILEVSARHHQLDTLCTFTVGANGHDDGKLLARLVALDGCDAVYCLAIGPSAIRQLIGAGIQPVRLEQPATIAILVAELQQQLRGSPAGWRGHWPRKGAARRTACRRWPPMAGRSRTMFESTLNHGA